VLTVAEASYPGAPRQRARLLGVTGLAGGLAAVATANLADPDAWSVVRGLAVGSYALVGVYTWWRRPDTRLGPYVAGIGLLYAVACLTASEDAVLHSAGRAALAAFVVCLAYVFLCFPGDRITAADESRLVAGLAVSTAALWLPALLFVRELPPAGPLTDCGPGCPDNAFRVADTPEALSSALAFAASLVTAVAVLGVIAALVTHVQSPARLRRRLVVPLLCASIALAISYVLYTLARQAELGGTDALRVLGAASALAIPAALLAGQLRGRVFAATSLGQLVARVGPGPATPARIETLLRDALGDPLLTLALPAPGNGGWLDVHGRPVELPAGRADVHVTRIARHGRPVAALVHDPALEDAAGIAEGLAATTLMLLDNARLVEELRASRGRIVASAQRERLRLEQNLHDGAQQRLFAVQLRLHELRSSTPDEAVATELAALADETAGAADELRALAHGLYPTVLRELGVADAVRSVAQTAAVPVRVVDRGVGRCPPTIEEAVYFCVLEAIQNATKHAGPDARVTVTLELDGDELRFAVADDGAGFDGAARGDGMGLVSMRDRIGAAGGELELDTFPGRGTTVRGRIPGCGRAGDGG
jgi:signal transduction histidine kinase